MDGYKTMAEIAKQCGTNKDVCASVARKEKISGHKFVFNNTKFYDPEQERRIYQILYYEGKIDHIILESKINKL